MTATHHCCTVTRCHTSHSKSRWWRACFVGVLASFTTWLVPPAARARMRTEMMLAEVPADAAIVVAWEGLSDEHPGYADSTLRQLLIDTQWPQRIQRTVGPLIEKLKQEEPQDAQEIEAFRRVLPSAWYQPWVFWFEVLNENDNLQAEPAFGWVIQAGDYSDDLRAALGKMLEKVDNPSLVMIDQDGLLGVRADQANAPEQPKAEPMTLPADGIEHPLVRVDVDVAKLFNNVFESPSFTNDGDSETFKQILEALGLLSLQRLSWAGGFTGKDWVSTTDALAPTPRKGIVSAVFDGPAIADDLMAMTGPSTVYARTMRLDAAATWDAIESAVRIGFKHEKGDDAEVDDGLAKLNELAGFDVRGQLIAGLGDGWLVYQDKLFPSAMMMSGVCIVHPLKDSDKARAALDQLTALVNQELENNGTNYRFEQREESGITMSVLSVPMFNPAWAIVDSKLVIGLSPQGLATAVEYLAPDAGSVMDSPGFVESMNLLEAPTPLHGRTFVNVQQTLIPQYNNLTTVLNLLSMGTQEEWGVDLRQVLPPLSTIMKHARPVAGVAWVDEQGYHSRARGPFPMANVLSPDASFGATYVSTVALLVGILLPALDAARRTARQMQDSTQGRGIHQGMIILAQSGKTGGGDAPLTDDIAELYEQDVITGSVEYFISGSSNTRIPDDFDEWDMEARKDWIRLNSDFIIVPGLVEDLDTTKIAVFLRPDIYADPPDRRGTVTYNDGHTVFEIDWDAVEAQLIKQTGMTAEQLIERQHKLAEQD